MSKEEIKLLEQLIDEKIDKALLELQTRGKVDYSEQQKYKNRIEHIKKKLLEEDSDESSEKEFNLTEERKEKLSKAVDKVIEEYGLTLKKLSEDD